jgi:hypothetical protein
MASLIVELSHWHPKERWQKEAEHEMKTKTVVCFSAAIYVASALLSNVCSGDEEADWRTCAEQSSATSFRTFLEKNPSSDHAREAEIKLAALVPVDEIAIKDLTALPARSDPRISCSLVEFKPSGSYSEEFSLQIPEDATEVAIHGLNPERKIGRILMAPKGDILIHGQFIATIAHPGDMISRAPGYVGVDKEGRLSLDTTGEALSGYWLYEEPGNAFTEFSTWLDKNAFKIEPYWWLFLDGNIMRFQGKIELLGFTFNGDAKDPMCFLVTRNGYVHLHGKGTVAGPGGISLTFPVGK